MEALNTRKNPLGGRLSRGADTLAKLRRFPSRFQELEQEVQETQRLHQRVAELTDIVAEILVPAADRDDERIRAVLAKYNETSF